MNNNIIQRYWNAYGGFASLLNSPYFYSSILITFLLFPSWSRLHWWDDVLSIMPNMLGFSLGGFALWMSIGSEKFRDYLAEKDKPCDLCDSCSKNKCCNLDNRCGKCIDCKNAYNLCENDEPSAFTMVNAIFLHFIILQVLSILSALICKTYSIYIDSLTLEGFVRYFILAFYAFSYLLFIYALISALTLSLGLFRVTTMYEHFVNEKISEDND